MTDFKEPRSDKEPRGEAGRWGVYLTWQNIVFFVVVIAGGVYMYTDLKYTVQANKATSDAADVRQTERQNQHEAALKEIVNELKYDRAWLWKLTTKTVTTPPDPSTSVSN